jgi:proline iminopeptidase
MMRALERVAALSAWVLIAATGVGAQGLEGYASSDGVETYYRVMGEGPPVLLINGGPGWSSDHMRGVAERLAPSRRVVVYDQRGTGRSGLAAVDTSTVSLALMIADIEALREHLGIDRWTVVGHSFGGLLGMAYAAEHPDRVRAMVLSAPAGADLEFLGYYPATLRERMTPYEREAADFWTDPERLAAAPAKATYELLKVSVGAFLYDRSRLGELLAAVDEATWNLAVAQLVWGDLIAAGFDVRREMRAFPGPVLVIQGRQDALGALSAFQVAELFPDGRLVIVEEAAHILWLDQPERYFEAVSGFLDAEGS